MERRMDGSETHLELVRLMQDGFERLHERIDTNANERRGQLEQLRRDFTQAQDSCRMICMRRLEEIEAEHKRLWTSHHALREDYRGIKWFAAKIAAGVGVVVGIIWPWLKAKMTAMFGGNQ